MTTLSLPLTPELAAGFAAVALYTSKAAATPVLGNVRVSHTHLLATDRYVVGRFEHTTAEVIRERHGENGPDDPAAFVLVPRAIAEWVSKNLPKYGEPTLILTDTAASISLGEGVVTASIGFESAVGLNYPPVERLIPDRTEYAADMLPVHIGADHLAVVAKSAQVLAKPLKVKNIPVRFQFAPDTERGNKAPAYLTIGQRFDGLLQPIKVN